MGTTITVVICMENRTQHMSDDKKKRRLGCKFQLGIITQQVYI
jgi:hypothetical protein